MTGGRGGGGGRGLWVGKAGSRRAMLRPPAWARPPAPRPGGPEPLSPRRSPGHPPKLSAAQKRLIPDFLWHGPEAYGFRGQVWTCARIARVIEEEFGVRYHKDHVGRLLRELRWTPQVPIRRAIQRDEEAIGRWRQAVWPDLLKRARRER